MNTSWWLWLPSLERRAQCVSLCKERRSLLPPSVYRKEQKCRCKWGMLRASATIIRAVSFIQWFICNSSPKLTIQYSGIPPSPPPRTLGSQSYGATKSTKICSSTPLLKSTQSNYVGGRTIQSWRCHKMGSERLTAWKGMYVHLPPTTYSCLNSISLSGH